MKRVLPLLITATLFFLIAPFTLGAGGSFYLAPSTGTFLVGSTFSLSIFVDTRGNEINAVQVDLKFPADILQVTRPAAGESFISQWLTPPTYSNTGGFVNFKGGIPEGIVTSAGLVSTITFRAKSSGKARIDFLDSCKILLNDGKGTPLTTNNFGGSYEILVPPHEGPKITSPTHPDSNVWYSNSTPSFSWEKEEGMTDFSFSFSQNPQEIPDTISEGRDTSTFYQDVSDGIWYFHVRAQKNNIWGRASHFEVRIDTTPPQNFEPRIDLPSGFVFFNTPDAHSGTERYEISVLNISETPAPAPFFIESSSPYKIPHQEPGKYSVIIRAYDKAGNIKEGETKFRMLTPAISYIEGEGIQVKGILFPWWFIYLTIFALLSWTIFLIIHFFRRRPKLEKGIKEIEEALSEIKKIEEKERKARKLKEEFREKREKLELELKEVSPHEMIETMRPEKTAKSINNYEG